MRVLVIGGGIGGLTTALSLHAAGFECDVYEQAHEIRELGVGINMLPHATKELAELGLLEALDRVAIRTYELIYANRFGQELWRGLRGCDAGYDYPQFSIHRGRLQRVLYEAVCARLGENHVHTSHQLHEFTQDSAGVTAQFVLRDGSHRALTVQGDVLIAADGIHSTVRSTLFPDEGPPRWNGSMLWRGCVAHPPFLTGRSMIIAGGMKAKLVLYPIARDADEPGCNLLNWAVLAKVSEGIGPPPRREDWSRPGQLDELLARIEGQFRIPVLDPIAVIRKTPEFYEYPMCDRDPLPSWSAGRITLLGDAAHPMYPVGSNGASQAILDARCLASVLAGHSDAVAALKAYEAARLPATAQIVRDNRAGGPERVIDVVESRAPGGFEKLEDVASHEELDAIVKGYSKIAGFDQQQVNR